MPVVSSNFRIAKTAEYERVYGRRCSASDGVLLVFAAENELGHVRVGHSVSRKVGGAVKRNRWKRLIRDAARLERDQLPKGVDFVVIPRAARPVLDELRQSLRSLSQRLARRLARERRS